MQTYKIDSIKFDRANIAGVDADAKTGLIRYLNARERELNTITTGTLICAGGPFDGQPLELEGQGIQRSADISVGSWRGFYEFGCDKETKVSGAMWRGNTAPEKTTFIETPIAATPTKAVDLGKGFTALADLLATMTQPVDGDKATFAIARCSFTVPNTPEAIERLRGRILKAKRWFSDKSLRVNAPARVMHEVEADPVVAETIAIAMTAAVIETASESSRESQNAVEVLKSALFTVACAFEAPGTVKKKDLLKLATLIHDFIATPDIHSPESARKAVYESIGIHV